ncbi:MAG: Fur family transcriptional regulator, partial [Gammaproteobacteria bacterium]
TATHNHSGCVRDALDSAERYCADKGLRLTDTRRRVLELIWGDHKPVGAYALLEQLGDDGRKAAPPTVYRALDFLLEHGLIHRVASLNAFIGCAHPGEAHDPQLFICERCGHAAELDDPGISRAIARDAKRMDFAIAHETVEISGLCGTCRRNES